MTSTAIDDKTYPTPAKIQKRIYAACLDFCVLVSIYLLVVTFLGETYITEDEFRLRLSGLPAFICFSFCILVVPIQEAVTGQTLGKRAFKLQVISIDNRQHSFGQPLIRHLFDFIDWFPAFGLTGIIVASNTRLNQRIGDLVAKTVVVDK